MIQWYTYVITPDNEVYYGPGTYLLISPDGRHLCCAINNEFSAWDLSFLTDEG